MLDILHKVGIKSSTSDVYKALTTREGLSDWWTTSTQAENKPAARCNSALAIAAGST